MMKALRCDRCGKFFTGEGRHPSVWTNPDGCPRSIYVESVFHSIDLCGTCRAELKEWWNAKGAPTDVQPDVNEEAQNDTNN